mmetsp:Transcript_10872/g.25197  ORF Transcript_10872/g.25197 Transcript_10872/m.25197 type:complete len:221 (-) Transcript_10872:490-1152(-)
MAQTTLLQKSKSNRPTLQGIFQPGTEYPQILKQLLGFQNTRPAIHIMGQQTMHLKTCLVDLHEILLHIRAHMIVIHDELACQLFHELIDCIRVVGVLLQLLVCHLELYRFFIVIISGILVKCVDLILEILHKRILLDRAAILTLPIHQTKHSLHHLLHFFILEDYACLFIAQLVARYVRHCADRDKDVQGCNYSTNDRTNLCSDQTKGKSTRRESCSLCQ